MTQPLNFESPVSSLPNIASVYKNRLSKLNIFTLRDLFYYFPFRYDDLSNKKTISELQVGEIATVQASLWQIARIRSNFGKVLIKATVNDGNSSLDVIWFNQIYLLSTLKPNQLINLSGKVGFFGKKLTLINPKYEIIKSGAPIHTERLVPVYPETAGVTSKWLRTRIHELLNLKDFETKELLPEKIMKAEKFPSLRESLQAIHFPTSLEAVASARKRFAFEELLLLHLRNIQLKKGKAKKISSISLRIEPTLVEKYEKSLPFDLTDSQKKAVEEILGDLVKQKPMNRLLQGEVGSGKTVVSSFAMLTTLANNYQVAFMAPTEILANQHFDTIKSFLGNKYKIELVTSSSKLKSTTFDVLVGTHALLNKTTALARLGLIIVDEQQRFGVVQRGLLREKGTLPHFLTMTATPIPRTLALTIYGELDISVLDKLPLGRKKIRTYLVPRQKRDGAYDFVKKEITKGGQVYVVCPFIEPSETLVSVKSAKEEFSRLQNEVFTDQKLELLHGKMSAKEKTAALENFRAGKIDVLVSTPVIEVGIDIPNVSVIIIEGSERFGLSSLHQLRGRVGRGTRESFCLLFTEKLSPSVEQRLKLLEKYDNGLELAEMDLKTRGSGDIFGTMQHGELGLNVASSADLNLIIETKKQAEMLKSEDLTPELLERVNSSINNQLSVSKD